jgi:hypothetical protein
VLSVVKMAVVLTWLSMLIREISGRKNEAGKLKMASLIISMPGVFTNLINFYRIR